MEPVQLKIPRESNTALIAQLEKLGINLAESARGAMLSIPSTYVASVALNFTFAKNIGFSSQYKLSALIDMAKILAHKLIVPKAIFPLAVWIHTDIDFFAEDRYVILCCDPIKPGNLVFRLGRKHGKLCIRAIPISTTEVPKDTELIFLGAI